MRRHRHVAITRCVAITYRRYRMSPLPDVSPSLISTPLDVSPLPDVSPSPQSKIIRDSQRRLAWPSA